MSTKTDPMVEANVKIIAELQDFLKLVAEDADIRHLFTCCPADFSRKRKLTLAKVVAMLVNLPKRSLCVELQDFFGILGEEAECCTKGAFSLQRVKLLPVLFSVWNRYLTDGFYKYYGSRVKRWKGHTILGVDGSSAYLFDKGDIKEYFGTQDNQFVEVPMARVLQIHDVLNNMTLRGDIAPFSRSEQHMLSTNLHHLPADSITILDRLYPGYPLMYLFINQEETPRHFLMRCKSSFNNVVKDFVRSGKHDMTVELKPNDEACKQLYKYGFIVSAKTAIKVRMVKVKLPTGEMEILITNLYDEELYSPDDLKQLYALRWRIETTYSKQKEQQQMEIFTGHKVICIKQDYAATLFTANLQSLIEKQTDKHVHYINTKRKHKYKINQNVSWAALKNNIVRLFFEEDTLAILCALESAFKRNLEPVRPGRKYARVRKAKKRKGKYQTYPNYRRAI